MVLPGKGGCCSTQAPVQLLQKKLLHTCAETSAKERKFRTGPKKLKVERKMNIPAPAQADDFESFLFCWQQSSSPLHSLSILPKMYISALALFSLLFSQCRKSSTLVLISFLSQEVTGKAQLGNCATRTFYILDSDTNLT